MPQGRDRAGKARNRVPPMRRLLVADRDGVSPVVATILLVAITVVLAAVLYAMVSGMFTPHSGAADYLGVEGGHTPDGTKWTLTFVSVSGTASQNDTFLVLQTSNGSTLLRATLFQLETTVNGVRYVPAQFGRDVLSPGDEIFIPESTYPSGTVYDLATSGSVLATGLLH